MLTTTSWQQIDLECNRSVESETGGILVGYYTDNGLMAVVTEALPPLRIQIEAEVGSIEASLVCVNYCLGAGIDKFAPIISASGIIILPP